MFTRRNFERQRISLLSSWPPTVSIYLPLFIEPILDYPLRPDADLFSFFFSFVLVFFFGFFFCPFGDLFWQLDNELNLWELTRGRWTPDGKWMAAEQRPLAVGQRLLDGVEPIWCQWTSAFCSYRSKKIRGRKLQLAHGVLCRLTRKRPLLLTTIGLERERERRRVWEMNSIMCQSDLELNYHLYIS